MVLSDLISLSVLRRRKARIRYACAYREVSFFFFFLFDWRIRKRNLRIGSMIRCRLGVGLPRLSFGHMLVIAS